MISPSELKEQMKVSQFEIDMQELLKVVDEKIREALTNGDIKIRLPYDFKLGNLRYHQDKTNVLAQRLLQLGYKCIQESNIIGGVLQKPRWYLYFY